MSHQPESAHLDVQITLRLLWVPQIKISVYANQIWPNLHHSIHRIPVSGLPTDLLMLILHLFFLWSKQKCDPLESCPLICLDLMSPHSSHLSLRVLRWHVTDSPIKMISQLLHSLLSVLSTLDGENQWDCGHGGSGDLKCVSHTRDRLSSFPWA